MPYKDKKMKQEYQKRVQNKYTITVSKVSEQEIIDHLEKHKPVNAYIKALIKKDLTT